MSSIIGSIDHVIRETPSESKCLKAIVLIPIVGHVVQAWKRHQLAALVVDQGESELEGREFKTYTRDELDTPEGRALFNDYRSKIANLDGFNRYCVNFGLIIDLTIVIGGLALSILAPPAGLAIAGFGLVSLAARNFIAMD